MYRQYENVQTLQERYNELEKRYNELKEQAERGEIENDDSYFYDMYIELQELNDRIRFAIDDEVFG